MKKRLMRLEELEIEPLADEVLRQVTGTEWCSFDACSICAEAAFQEWCSFDLCSGGDPGDPPDDPCD